MNNSETSSGKSKQTASKKTAAKAVKKQPVKKATAKKKAVAQPSTKQPIAKKQFRLVVMTTTDSDIDLNSPEFPIHPERIWPD